MEAYCIYLKIQYELILLIQKKQSKFVLKQQHAINSETAPQNSVKLSHYFRKTEEPKQSAEQPHTYTQSFPVTREETRLF